MSFSIANLSWPYVSGSVSTKVEYKLDSDPNWITPTSPSNPTTNNYYPIQIVDGQLYDVKLTTNGLSCGPSSTTLQIINPGGTACCPATYTLSVDATYCYKYVDIPATPPVSSENTVAAPYFNYGAYGSVIYNPGYSLDGYGPFTLINTSNPFWINSALSFSAGPNNRTALWATTVGSNQDVGFSVCVNLPTSGTYYVGCFADNSVNIKVDGVAIVTMNVANMTTYFEANGYPGIGASVTFYFWHIYPIALTAGSHVIEIIGHNVSGPAAMGTEVYNATSAEIQAATSYASLGAKLIFSSKDYFGQPVQIGSGGIGYSCPSGYSLVLCDGSPYCRQTLTTATISC